MEVNDPDFDAFKSASSAYFQARELGKIEVLIPNLLPNAPVPEAMGKQSHENAPQESQCYTSSHWQSESSDWDRQGGCKSARGVLKSGAYVCRLKFWKQMILSEQSGQILILELKQEALRNNWMIEINRGEHNNTNPRMTHMTAAAIIQQQKVWSDWHGLISMQKIKMETSKNNSATEIEHREIPAVGRIEVTLGFADHFAWKSLWLPVENCQQ